MTVAQYAALHASKTTGAQMLEWDGLATYITKRLPYTLPDTQNDVLQAIIRFYAEGK